MITEATGGRGNSGKFPPEWGKCCRKLELSSRARYFWRRSRNLEILSTNIEVQFYRDLKQKYQNVFKIQNFLHFDTNSRNLAGKFLNFPTRSKF
ncbi:MAG: hypothetical protein FD143_3561 [Ignavibacteria bacterium]|nr:MAG: hypothetical protein FD143_3561 [Ignavibacteria bacterium]